MFSGLRKPRLIFSRINGPNFSRLASMPWQECWKFNLRGYGVQEKRVQETMRRVDPEGVIERSISLNNSKAEILSSVPDGPVAH